MHRALVLIIDVKKPWPHFNGDTIVISTITRYYAIVRNSRGPFSPSIGREISLSASWNAHEDQRYPGNRLRGKGVRVRNISHLRCRVQPPRLIQIQRCIRVACAPLVFRLNGEKWICLSFRTRRVVEIRRNVTCPRRRNGKDG